MRGVRRWWVLLGGVLVTAGLGWWVWQVTQHDERDSAASVGQFVVAAAGLMLVVAGGVRKAFTPPPPPSLDELSDLLAVAMRHQWEQAAIDRRLLEPAPLPIRWSRASVPVAGPPGAATADGNGQARFDSLPGLTRTTTSRLRTGTRRTLHSVYGVLASGRLLLIGGAGTGKSAAAILLLLDALRFRTRTTSDEDRRRIPVPVLFTLHGWDPTTTSVQDWLVTTLTGTPLFAGRGGARNARRLLTAGRIAVFLDGLDEVPDAVRPVALQALSEQATFRLVLLTRTPELLDAAAHGPLVGAAALHLRPVTPTDAADYLLHPLLAPPSAPWQAITDELTQHPTSPLARALDSPLTITLLRDAYPPHGPVDELLDTTRFPTSDAITNHLLDHALTAAYTPRVGQPPPPYTLATAHRTLSYLAHHLHRNNTRNLAWWQLPQATSRAARLLLSGPTFRLVYGLMFGFAVGPWYGFPAGLGYGLGYGLVAGFLAWIMGDKPNRIRWHIVSPARGKRGLLIGLAAVLAAAGLLYVLAAGFPLGLTVELRNWLLPYVLLVVLPVGLAVVLTQANIGDTRTNGPLETWRHDVATGLVGGFLGGFGSQLVFGLVFGLVLALVGLTAADLAAWLEGGLVFGLALALIGLTSTTVGRLLVFQAFLALRRRTPWRLMRFLEDARARHVLRTVGPIYQFRHATLQDRLAQRLITPIAQPDRTSPANHEPR